MFFHFLGEKIEPFRPGAKVIENPREYWGFWGRRRGENPNFWLISQILVKFYETHQIPSIAIIFMKNH